MRKPVICVYSSAEGASPYWMSNDDRHRLTQVPDLGAVTSAIDPARSGSSDEFVAVILDRSVTARALLQLLTKLPEEFRGDVLRIDRDGSGVLSTCAIRDGRNLYQLDPDDVEFYLDARFGISETMPIASIARPALRLTA